jgi:hypothetical protein
MFNLRQQPFSDKPDTNKANDQYEKSFENLL